MKLVDALIRFLKAADSVTVLTGAGVSAESGIPTFRDALTGLWAKYDPEELATPEAFLRNPKLVWDWYAHRREMVQELKPNAGHIAIAELESLVPTFKLITQNVDGFHQLAGSQDVTELHGNITRVRCFDYGHSAETWAIDGDMPPSCQECGGMLRPDVVWFGESLSRANLENAAAAASTCDVFLSIGTSSLVYPAAGLPPLAIQEGATFVEVNPNQTPLSEYADFIISADSGSALPAIVTALKS